MDRTLWELFFSPFILVLSSCGTGTSIPLFIFVEPPTPPGFSFLFYVLSLLLPKGLGLNDHYPWKAKEADKGEHSIDVATKMAHFFLIPFVKRVLYITCQIAFTIFFCFVALQPLCGPLDVTHYALGAWIIARTRDQTFHASFHRKDWWRNNYVESLEVASTVFLVVAACLRVSLASASSIGADGTFVAVDGSSSDASSLSFYNASSCLALDARRRHIYSGGCDWSPQYEALRCFLAFASIALFARCSEIFFVSFHARSGVLIIAANMMIRNMIEAYLAPFWGFYDLTPDPNDMVEHYDDASFLTPFFIWIESWRSCAW